LHAPGDPDPDDSAPPVYPLNETRFHRMTLAAAGFLCTPWVDLELSGFDRLPREGAAVLVANHTSEFDLLALQLAIPRPLFSMQREEWFRDRARAALLRPLGVFPTASGGRNSWAFAHAANLLRHGQLVCLFPEGTPSQGRGLKVARSDAARLALIAGCPILPVAIEGSATIFHQPGRAHVRLKLCEIIQPRRNELALALTDRLMFDLARNLPPRLQGVYAQALSGFD